MSDVYHGFGHMCAVCGGHIGTRRIISGYESICGCSRGTRVPVIDALDRKITQNFVWAELIRDSNLDDLTYEIEENLLNLTGHILQPLRDEFGRPIHVNSGWRDPAKNAAIGGHPSSYHMLGLAADIAPWHPEDGALHRMWDILMGSRLPFDKVCLYPTFIHVNIAKGPITSARRLAYKAPDGVWTDKTHVPYNTIPHLEI